jgi:hypothetical protein
MQPRTLIRYIKSPSKLDADSLMHLQDLISENPYCSTLRMLLVKNHQVLNTADKDKILKETAIYAHDRKKFFNIIHDISNDLVIQPTAIFSPDIILDDIQNIEREVLQHRKDTNDDLIDKFIREQPKISAIAKEEINNNDEEDLPQEVEMEQEFLSEILAEIYWKQGNRKKALLTYEKLCLRIPEKSSYFAAQIEKIKKEII